MAGNDLVGLRRAKPAKRGWGILDLALVVLATSGVLALAWIGAGRYLATPPQALVRAAAISASPWTAQDESRCKASGRTAQGSAFASAGLADRTVVEGFANLATVLHCRLATKSNRFCDPSEKSAMVAMVQDYFGRLDLIGVGLGLQGAPMHVVGNIAGGEAAMGRDIYDMQVKETFALMKPFHDQIGKDLQRMARSGIVSEKDFAGFMGMGVPDRINKMIGAVTPEVSICT